MTCIATAPVSPRRAYQYDTLGRPTSRTLARQGATRNDVFNYNDRSELISDVVDGTGLNGWDYDLAAAASSSGVASRQVNLSFPFKKFSQTTKNHKIMNTGNTYGIHVLDPNHLAEARDYPVPFGSFNPFVGTEPVTMLVQLTSAHEKHNLAEF